MRRGFGTTRRSAIDPSRMAEAFSRPGIDPRLWVAHGTVSTGEMDAEGSIDVNDPLAVHVGPMGVDVDVVLHPANIPVTCKYAGIQGGTSCTIFAPIHPGDLVLVVLPGGDLAGTPVIVAILNSASAKMLTDPDDGRKPFFQNDRLSVFAENVPIDIRTRGGARALLQQDGNVIVIPGGSGIVKLGGDDASLQPAALATTLKAHLDALKTAFDSHVHGGVTSGTSPTLPPAPFFPPTPDVEADKVKVK